MSPSFGADGTRVVAAMPDARVVVVADVASGRIVDEIAADGPVDATAISSTGDVAYALPNHTSVVPIDHRTGQTRYRVGTPDGRPGWPSNPTAASASDRWPTTVTSSPRWTCCHPPPVRPPRRSHRMRRVC